MTKALEGVRGQRHASAALYPRKDPVPIVQEAGWAPRPVWAGAKNLATPGFDPRTVQPVASRYTDYATRHTLRFLNHYQTTLHLLSPMPNIKHNTSCPNHKSIINDANKQLIKSLSCNVNTLHLTNTVMLSVRLTHSTQYVFFFLL